MRDRNSFPTHKNIHAREFFDVSESRDSKTGLSEGEGDGVARADRTFGSMADGVAREPVEARMSKLFVWVRRALGGNP